MVEGDPQIGGAGAGEVDASSSADAGVTPRRPGRAKGSPRVPGSGRKKGTPNRFSGDVRSMIMERGQPIEFLCCVARGLKIRTGPQVGPGRPTFTYPTLEQRIRAAELLARKIVPDMSSAAITGDGGGPVVVAHDTNDVVSSARWIAFALSRAKRLIEEENPSPIITPAPACEPVDITHRQILGTGGSVPEAGSPPPRFEGPIDLGGPVRIGGLEVRAMNGRHVVVRIEDGRALSFFSSRREAVAFAKARATAEVATSTASDPV